MTKLEAYLAQREAESQALWATLITGRRTSISREETMQRMQASAEAKGPVVPVPPRDLAAEHEELRFLFQKMPWLKLRKAASELGLAEDTYDALFAEKGKKKFRPLTNINDADTLWLLLRTTLEYIKVALPE